MNGNTSKYRKYEGKGSGEITIPIAIARALSWKDGDEINIIFETMNNKKGIFLSKKEK